MSGVAARTRACSDSGVGWADPDPGSDLCTTNCPILRRSSGMSRSTCMDNANSWCNTRSAGSSRMCRSNLYTDTPGTCRNTMGWSMSILRTCRNRAGQERRPRPTPGIPPKPEAVARAGAFLSALRAGRKGSGMRSMSCNTSVRKGMSQCYSPLSSRRPSSPSRMPGNWSRPSR